MKHLRRFNIIMACVWLLLLGVSADAQMPAPPGGFVHVGPPWFTGCVEIFSSPTVQAHNWYGSYRLDVIAGAPGVGLWEAANSYRGGAASLEPIIGQDGVPLLVQDITATWWNVRLHDGAENIMDSNVGHWQFFTTGGNNALQVFAPGQVPAGGSTHHTDVRHDDAEGFVESLHGDLRLDAVNDVYTMDHFGSGTNAPTEEIHVAGSIRMVNGNEGVGTIVGDDGTGTGVFDHLSFAQLTGSIWFLYDTASGDIAGYDTLFADPSVGGVQSYNIAIPASPTLIEEFATEIGEPGITFIQNGVLTFHFDARRSAGTMECDVYAEVYTRTHPVGLETLLCTTETSNYLTNVQQSYEIHAICPARALNATDRLVVKVYGNQYPPGANPTIQFYVEGTTDTRIQLPGVEAGTGMAHIMIAVPVQGAEPTRQILEVGTSEDAMDFQVEVNCHDLNSDTVWPALGSRWPVADLITFYWEIDGGDLVVNIVNDSQKDVMAMVWWGK